MASQDTATSITADDVDMMDSQVSDTQREPILKSDDEDENVGARSGSSLGGFWDIQGWNPDYQRELEDVARRGFTAEQVPFLESSDWIALTHMLKIKIVKNLADLLLSPHNASALISNSSSSTNATSTSKQHPLNRGEGSADSFAAEPEQDQYGTSSSVVMDLTPSTQGGLIIPPFPPLVPNRDRARGNVASGSSSSPGAGAGQGYTGIGQGQGVQGYTHHSIQAQSSQSQAGSSSAYQQTQPIVNAGPGSGVMGDPLYDEEAAIGGKVLPGKLRPREAEGMVEGIWRLLDEFQDDPPFTVQRLCELAAFPMKQHRLPGKYVRALERVLLVTTTFDPNASIGTTTGGDTIAPGSGVPGVPPALALERPLFGLIPFLNEDAGEETVMPRSGSSGDTSSSAAASGSGTTATTSAPIDMDLSSSTPLGGPPVAPTPEPFLGRVDELDAGPLITPPLPTDTNLAGTGVGGPSTGPGPAEDPHRLRANGETGSGGAGGGVVQHGLSERPRAISSTTDLSALDPSGGGLGAGGYRDGHEEDEDGESGSSDMESDTASSASSTVSRGSSVRVGPVDRTKIIRPRRISKLPRTVSTQSLNERFVSTGVEVIDPGKEERARLGGTPGEASGAVVRADSEGIEAENQRKTGTTDGPDEGHGIKVERKEVQDEEGKEDEKVGAKKEGEEEGQSGVPAKVRKVE